MSSSEGQRDVVRLSRLAGMLGSNAEGERASAARLATLQLQRMGLTWAELILRAFRSAPEPEPKPKAEDPYRYSWEPPQDREYTQSRRTSIKDGLPLWKFVAFASARMDRLSSWDRNFVSTFLHFGPRCSASEAQWAQVFRICKTLGVDVEEMTGAD
jgi:hypothetical protein